MKRELMEYLFKEVYFLGENLHFQTCKIKVCIRNKFSLDDSINAEFDNDIFEINSKDPELNITIDFNAKLSKDGYTLKITKDKRVYITAESKRSVCYAVSTLKSIVDKKEYSIEIPIISIEDYPSFSMRGIIEGFYGVPWSHEDRLDCIDFMKYKRMNVFMYAPKDDEYHRKLWRKNYPKDKLENLLELKNKCDENNIDFCYCISPGNDFEYTKDEDFSNLFSKLHQVIEHGVNRFALLMDDIHYTLEGENKLKFKRPGVAHAYISNRVNKYLKDEIFDYTLVMCPTEYYENWDTEYRKDIRKHMDKDIKVFWTGYNTVAEAITNEDGKNAEESFGHDLVLWDNYPVNDFAVDRIFLGPILNRGRKLYETHVGIVSNPMNQWYLSKVALGTFSHYMWNPEKYNPEISYEISIRDLVGDEMYKDFRLFSEANRNSVIDYYEVEELNTAIKEKKIDTIDNYFSRLKESINNIKKIPNNDMIDELQPWFQDFDAQYELWVSIKDGKNDIDEKVKNCLERKVSFGFQGALIIAKNWNLTNINIEEKKRMNFSEL